MTISSSRLLAPCGGHCDATYKYMYITSTIRTYLVHCSIHIQPAAASQPTMHLTIFSVSA